LTNGLGYAAVESDVRYVLERREPVEKELQGLDERWFLMRIDVYRTGSQSIDGVVITLVDISDRKHAELALREANKRKDEFLATLAHELRNPLAPISAGLEVLKMVDDPKTVEQVRETMDRQTRQLVRLVDDLMDVSRVSGGRLRLRKAPTDLADVVRDAVASARPFIERSRHELEVILPDRPLIADVDAARITQALANVLNNAAKYTPDGGKILLRTDEAAGCCEIRVRDSGVGIVKEDLQRVFDLFFSSGADHVQSINTGLGIGLTLAKSLVELHGGKLSVESEGRGSGSEFTIRLPAVTAAHAAADRETAPAEQCERLSGHRVLIVDDNADAADTLGMLIETLGRNEIRIVNDGVAALRTAAELQPDIVLLDIGMPHMSGLEVARRMRRESWCAHATLVAVTGWGQEEDKRRAREAGFDRHIVKPADREALETIFSEPSRSSSAR
jgi:signal transduction histidine kinase/ActR/RegA family two-component response regulator